MNKQNSTLNNLSEGRYIFFSSMLERLSSVLFFFVTAKYLPAELYGKYASISAVCVIIITCFDFGIPVYIQRLSAKNKDKKINLSGILLIKSVSYLLYYLVLIIYLLFAVQKSDFVLLLFISVSILLYNLIGILNPIFYGQNKSRITFRASIFSRIFLLGIFAVVILNLISVYAFLLFLILSNFIQILILFSSLWNYAFVKLDSGLIPEAKKIFLTALPLGFSVVFNLIYDKIDIVLLTVFLNYNKVAQYSIAYNIYKLSGIVFSSIALPAFTRFANSSKREAFEALFRYAKTIFYSSLVMMILIFIFGRAVILSSISDRYSGAAEIMPLFSVAVLFLGMNYLTGIFLNGVGKFNYTLIAVVSGVSVNILANVFLIPRYGIQGAVYSTIITELVILIVEIYFIKKYLFTPEPE